MDGLDGVCYERAQLGCSCDQGCICLGQAQKRDAQRTMAWHIHWDHHLHHHTSFKAAHGSVNAAGPEHVLWHRLQFNAVQQVSLVCSYLRAAGSASMAAGCLSAEAKCFAAACCGESCPFRPGLRPVSDAGLFAAVLLEIMHHLDLPNMCQQVTCGTPAKAVMAPNCMLMPSKVACISCGSLHQQSCTQQLAGCQVTLLMTRDHLQR